MSLDGARCSGIRGGWERWGQLRAGVSCRGLTTRRQSSFTQQRTPRRDVPSPSARDEQADVASEAANANAPTRGALGMAGGCSVCAAGLTRLDDRAPCSRDQRRAQGSLETFNLDVVVQVARVVGAGHSPQGCRLRRGGSVLYIYCSTVEYLI